MTAADRAELQRGVSTDGAELQGVSTEQAPQLVTAALVAEVNHESAFHRNPEVAADGDHGHHALPLRCARLFGVLLSGGRDVLSIERVGVAFTTAGRSVQPWEMLLRLRRTMDVPVAGMRLSDITIESMRTAFASDAETPPGGVDPAVLVDLGRAVHVPF